MKTVFDKQLHGHQALKSVVLGQGDLYITVELHDVVSWFTWSLEAGFFQPTFPLWYFSAISSTCCQSLVKVDSLYLCKFTFDYCTVILRVCFERWLAFICLFSSQTSINNAKTLRLTYNHRSEVEYSAKS